MTRTLSKLKEAAGDVNAASELMQELQVETFGSMERREKVDFILEQMRLLKAQDDWEKMAIVSKRINLKWLADKEHEVRHELSSSRPFLVVESRPDLSLSLSRRTSSCATTPS